MSKNYLTECRISIMWDDGQVEQLSILDLPEHITNELRTYFKELEDMRYEDKDTYDTEYFTYTRELTL